MKGLLVVLGALFEVLGIYLILQGVGVITERATGVQVQWIVIGIAADLAGTLLIVLGLRRRQQ